MKLSEIKNPSISIDDLMSELQVIFGDDDQFDDIQLKLLDLEKNTIVLDVEFRNIEAEFSYTIKKSGNNFIVAGESEKFSVKAVGTPEDVANSIIAKLSLFFDEESKDDLGWS